MRASSFALLATLLVVGQSVGAPLVAAAETCESQGVQYNCLTETPTVEHRAVAYKFNGTIVNGTIPINSTQNVFDSWPAQIGAWPVEDGLRVGAGVEALVGIPHRNTAGTLYSYTPNATLDDIYTSPTTSHGFANLVPVVRYTLMPNSSQLMSGSSFLYFRGAADVNASDNVVLHALDVRQDGRVVMRMDTTSLNDSRIYNGRAYYRLSFPFTVGHAYTFTEYVRYLDTSAPVDLVKVWATVLQNPGLGDDNFTAFPGDAAQQRVNIAPSYSMQLRYGIGPAGLEELVAGNSTWGRNQVDFQATGAVGADPTRVSLLIPLRHTRPMDFLVCYQAFNQGPDEVVHAIGSSCSTWYHNVSGSFLADFPVTHLGYAPNRGNVYQVSVYWNMTDGDALTYSMFPTDDAWGAAGVGLTSGINRFGHVQTQRAAIVGPYTNDSAYTDDGAKRVHFVGFLPWMETMREDNSTLGSFDLNGRLEGLFVLVNSITIFTLQYLTPIGGVFSVLDVAAGVAPSASGTCHLINGAWTGASLPGMFCDEKGLKNVETALTFAATGISCTLAVIEGGTNIIADALCLLGLISSLYALGIDVFSIIKQAVELLGQVLFWLVNNLENILFIAFVIVGAFAIPGAIKLVVLLGLSIVSWFTSKFDHVYARVQRKYIFIWSDLVERRIFKWNVQPPTGYVHRDEED